MSNLLLEKINTQCRICLCYEPKMIGIFSSTANFNSISSVIMECAPIIISETDSLPHTICEACLERLEYAHSFRQLCVNSDAALRAFNIEEIKHVSDSERNSPVQFDETFTSEEKPDIIDEPLLDFDSQSGYSNTSNDIKLVEITKKPSKRRSRIRKLGPKKRPIFPDANGLFTCDVCKNQYKRKPHLERHLIAHSDFRFHCETCGRSFVRKSNLQLHMKTHSDVRMYSCEFCGVTFRTRKVLRNHQTIHLNVRPYECGMCEKKFRQKKGLENHERTHTGDRPFGCETCGKRFNRKHHLRTHSQIHGERNFKCELCPQTFISKQNLNLHVLRH